MAHYTTPVQKAVFIDTVWYRYAANRWGVSLPWWRRYGTMLAIMDESEFWRRLDQLVAACNLIVDRPKGMPHPRYPSFTYPLDYGYLEGTIAADRDGIDAWVGSLPDRRVTAIICTIDLEQRDAEVKILLGCTAQEAREILAIHNAGFQSSVLMERPGIAPSCSSK
jgi:inorganic pyrophosphatase